MRALFRARIVHRPFPCDGESRRGDIESAIYAELTTDQCSTG